MVNAKQKKKKKRMLDNILNMIPVYVHKNIYLTSVPN